MSRILWIVFWIVIAYWIITDPQGFGHFVQGVGNALHSVATALSVAFGGGK